MKDFRALLAKDIRLMASGKFFLMSFGFLILYTLYVNLGYVKFMDAQLYNVYLYDPEGTQTAASQHLIPVTTRESLEEALLEDLSGIGIDCSSGEPRFLFYEGTPSADRHRADYAFSLLQPTGNNGHQTVCVGSNTPEQKARKEIACELLFFEISAVGFLGIAAVLFKEKGMGVLRIHAILPLQKNLFLLSKLLIFLLSDLVFAVLLTLLNIGPADTAVVLPAVLVQAALLSILMALIGLVCTLTLKDFRQFTLVYLLIAIFVSTPVFLSANTAVKLDWISFHPFYHIYMGLKNAYFGMPIAGLRYHFKYIAAILVLYIGAHRVFYREMRREG